VLQVKRGPPRNATRLANGGPSRHAHSRSPGRRVSSIVCKRSTHGQEVVACGAAGDQYMHKRPDAHNAKPEVTWHVALQPGKSRALDKSDRHDQTTDPVQKANASIRANVAHKRLENQRPIRRIETKTQKVEVNGHWP
jgi:hypothetical protein